MFDGPLADLDILAKVEKPARYTGGEWNEIRKAPDEVKVTVALAFPDVYEVGMSYLGQKILYSLLNNEPEIAAERVFSPWPDYEAALRQAGRPLRSLESGRPLNAFDIIGFSLLYELNYSNILTILDLGLVPLHARDRDLSRPLVIAGGPAAFNPEPVSDIFDFFLIGDGEEAFPEIIRTYLGIRGAVRDRNSLVRAFARIPGVYVPSLYEIRRQDASRLVHPVPKEEGVPPVIKKRIIRDFEKSFFPEKIVVPNLKIIFDRIAVEAARGCPQNCRFCQASSLYFPCREKDPGRLLTTLIGSLRQTGYDSASLSALSIGDYSNLEWTLKSFMDIMAKDKISLSLPSIRPQTLSREIVAELLRVRKTGFTLVPEAGTDRLRAVINKRLTAADIENSLIYAFEGGWRLIKLYFMIGLPTETGEDLEGIISVVSDAVNLGRKILGGPPRLNVSLSSFIPKPHTPFQWVGMDEEGLLREKQAFLKAELARFRTVKIREHDVGASILEAVFSRGDRRLNRVLLEAWRKGVRFDGWAGYLNRQAWEYGFGQAGIEMKDYLSEISRAAFFPWSHIDPGLKEEYLASELDKARRGERSENCREKDCADCLGCDPRLRPFKSRVIEVNQAPELPAARRVGKRTPELVRYWAYYSKLGKMRLVSHVDLINILQRGFRRAGIGVKTTEGFHPKPDFSYGPALPLGMESLNEALEFRSNFGIGEKEFLEAMNGSLPAGLRFSGLDRLPGKWPSLQASIEALIYSLDPSEIWAAQNRSGRSDSIGAFDSSGLSAKFKDMLSGHPEAGDIRLESDGKRIRLNFPPVVRKGWRPQDLVAEVTGMRDAVYVLRRDAVVLRKPPVTASAQPFV